MIVKKITLTVGLIFDGRSGPSLFKEGRRSGSKSIGVEREDGKYFIDATRHEIWSGPLATGYRKESL